MGDNEKDLLKLAQSQSDALLNAEMDARDEELQRGIDNQLETEALAQSHKTALDAQNAFNKEQYQNQGQIINDIQTKIDAAKTKDADAQKRENAFRYISGLGDTLSSLANLVGTAHGAANQQQVYNSSTVVQKAEEARKARKIEMEDLSKRLDEMKARQRDLQAAGNLEAAKLKAAQEKEMFQLAATQRKEAEAAKRYNDDKARQAMTDARNIWEKDRAFKAAQDQAKQTQENWQKTYEQTLAQFEYNKDKDNYPIFLQDGSRLDISKNSFNDVSVGELFALLPPEKQKEVKGKPYTKKYTNSDGDEVEETDYEAPSLERKLAAVVAYAKDPSSDPTRSQQIKDKMVTMATAKPFKEKDENGRLNVPNW